MNLQLFPDRCGFEVAEAWCPLTNLETYLIAIIGTLLVVGVLWIIMRLNSKKENE